MKPESLSSAILFSLILSGCDPTSGPLENHNPNLSANPRTLCSGADADRSDEYGGGNGTKENPFLICTTDQFKSIQGNMSDKRFFRITRDLDFLNEENLRIVGISPFASIDGGNHRLKNIRIKHGYGFKDNGLFGQLVKDLNGNRDEIKNLIIENVTLTGDGTEDGGGVIASANCGGIISNVHVSGIVKIEYPNSAATSWSTGGLVGRNSWIIENSSFEGQVSGVYNVGGIAGINDGIIRDSISTGTIKGMRGAGGIVGVQLKSGKLENSSSQATITANLHYGNPIGLTCPSDDYSICTSQLFE